MSSEVDRVLAWETSSDSASVPESLTNLLRLAEEAGEEGGRRAAELGDDLDHPLRRRRRLGRRALDE